MLDESHEIKVVKPVRVSMNIKRRICDYYVNELIVFLKKYLINDMNCKLRHKRLKQRIQQLLMNHSRPMKVALVVDI